MQTLAQRCWALIPLLALAGCGQTGPECVRVSGTVTLDGAKVPGPGFIYFTTDGTSSAGVSRPGTAEFDADGNYRAQTFTAGDGLLPGKYLLRIDCWKVAPNMDGKPVSSFIPARYQNPTQSQLELTVEPGGKPVTYNIDLKSK